jgi:hypothetical protein
VPVESGKRFSHHVQFGLAVSLEDLCVSLPQHQRNEMVGVDRHQLAYVAIEEGLPALRRRSTLSGQESTHGSFRDLDTKLEQLSMDAGRTHSGLAAAIFMIKARISGRASGRPLHFLLEIQVQKRRKPLRCQDTTVSCLTMIKARRQCFQVLERHSQNNRSAFRSRGLGQRRLNTVSCWRRAKFSRAIS